MLTQSKVVAYLIERGLVSTETLVEGDLMVVEASRRNRNFKVISERSSSYLLKQGGAPNGVGTVAYEAGVYQLLQSGAGNDDFSCYLPRCYGYDPDEHILILELLTDGQNLREYQVHRGRFPTTFAALVGDALGTFHRAMQAESIEDGTGHTLSNQPPAVLSIHHPTLRLFQSISGATIRLIKIIQQFPKFCELLDGLRQGWRSEMLIHGDLRWDNCIVFRRSATWPKSSLRLVDWEFARIGDPCWDVGSVFGEYLGFWLLSIPIATAFASDRSGELSQFPLGRMQPAMRSFWRSYARRMDLDSPTSEEWLLRAVQYGAVRLIETACEQMHTATQLTGNVVCLLQLSMNILQRPREAIVQLLGIPLPKMEVL